MGGFGSKLVALGEHAIGALADRPVHKAIGATLGGVWESGEHALRRAGSWSGMLAALLRTTESNSRRAISEVIQPIAERATKIAADPTAHKAWHVVRTTGKLTGNNVIDRAALDHRALDSWAYQMHVDAGFPVAPRVEGIHFTESYPPELFEAKTVLHKQGIQLILAKGKAKDVASAEKLLSEWDSSYYEVPRYGKKVTGTFHPIETRRRLDLPELARKDIAVDFEYLAGALRSYHEKKVFGPHGEQLTTLLQMIRKSEGEVQYRYAVSLASNFLGHDAGSIPGEMEKSIRSYMVASKLGRAVLSHPVKTLDSILVQGQITPFLKAIATGFTDPEEWRAVGIRAAAGLNETIHEIRRAAQIENESLGSKVLRLQGFMKVINFQEYLNANMAKHAVLDDVDILLNNPNNKGALSRLRTLRLFPEDILKRGGASDTELAIAGHQMNNLVLGGRRTVLDLPPSWKGHWSMRMITMFRPFLFNQAKIIKDHVILPALRDGNLKPLMYMSILYPTFGELAADLKTIARGHSLSERPDWNRFPYDRIIDNVASVGGFGVAADMLSATTSASPITTWKMLYGVVESELVDDFNFLIHVLDFSKHNLKNELRFLLRRVPGIGLGFSNTLLPSPKPYESPLQRGVVTKKIHSMERSVGLRPKILSGKW